MGLTVLDGGGKKRTLDGVVDGAHS
jgi:hypothetical protein